MHNRKPNADSAQSIYMYQSVRSLTIPQATLGHLSKTYARGGVGGSDLIKAEHLT